MLHCISTHISRVSTINFWAFHLSGKKKKSYSYERPLVIILILITQIFVISTAQSRNITSNGVRKSSVSAVFVFGDSTVDSGVNNYLATISKSNFPPYGRDFVNHKPTGRFSNGRLVTDFIASFVGVKENIPPYLDPSLSIEELMTGVSFASGGSGYDTFTATISSSLDLPKQVELFRHYRAKVESVIGKDKTQDIISRAGFLVSTGTNDFTFNYFGLPVRRQTYPTVSSFQNFLMQNVDQFVQDLLKEGATKIGVVGLPPIGCLPAIITINSDNAVKNRQCIERLNKVSRDYNTLLQNNLKSMQKPNTNIVYADIYNPIFNMIQQKSKFGFQEVHSGCCGTGLIEATVLCNPKSPLCSDVSKYLFWDSFHPTEKAYFIIFDSLRPVIQKYIA